VTGRQANRALAQQVVTQQQTITTPSAAPDTPVTVSGTCFLHSGRARAIIMGHAPHTAQYLFGNECDFMKRNRWWNEITATRREADLYNIAPDNVIAFRRASSVF
jgi:hypothetical protein